MSLPTTETTTRAGDDRHDDGAGPNDDPAGPGVGWRRYPYVLAALFAVVFAVAAIRPWHLPTWALENFATGGFVWLLWFTRKRLPLSNVSYTLIFVYLTLHTVGAHYTYSKVPYDTWFRSLFGTTLSDVFDFQRNHYDRLIHFLFGLLIAYPIREMFVRVAGARGFWGYYLPLDVTMSFSMLYELIEWGAAELFGGETGHAYLGTQGDVWDAHKDMALATIGGAITMGLVAAINWKLNRRFAAEIKASLQVKDERPLGEVRLREMTGRGPDPRDGDNIVV